MASGINKAILIGNLGSDPELRQTQGGKDVCNFRMATSEKWTDQGGESQERTEWHRVVVWGKLATVCAQYLAKGRRVYVEGKIQTRTYDKEGQTHYATEINASTVLFLDGGGQGRGSTDGYDEPSRPITQREKWSQQEIGDRPRHQPPNDDDIPF